MIPDRYLLLYKYGGVYLDTDVILIRPLPLHSNYAGVESWDLHHIGAGVIKFQKHHQITLSILNTLAVNFSGSDWGANGPLVLEAELRKVCENDGGGWWSGGGDVDGWRCGDVTIFRQEYFYAIQWKYWETLFLPEHRDNIIQEMRTSYAVHLWGHKSGGVRVERGSAVGHIATHHCPAAAPTLINW